MKIGDRMKVVFGSGLDSDRIGTIVPYSEVPKRQTGGGIIPDILGHYKPFDPTREKALIDDDGKYFTMFNHRLVPCPDTPQPAQSSERSR